MSHPQLRIERLGAQHDLSTFQSGNAELDGWLRRHALAAQEMDSARTFLLVDGERIVGYFSLTMAMRYEPTRRRSDLPAYPVGMVLLARLAVDNREQGKGVGALMLADATAATAAVPAHERTSGRASMLLNVLELTSRCMTRGARQRRMPDCRRRGVLCRCDARRLRRPVLVRRTSSYATLPSGHLSLTHG